MNERNAKRVRGNIKRSCGHPNHGRVADTQPIDFDFSPSHVFSHSERLPSRTSRLQPLTTTTLSSAPTRPLPDAPGTRSDQTCPCSRCDGERARRPTFPAQRPHRRPPVRKVCWPSCSSPVLWRRQGSCCRGSGADSRCCGEEVLRSSLYLLLVRPGTRTSRTPARTRPPERTVDYCTTDLDLRWCMDQPRRMRLPTTAYPTAT